MRVTVTIDEDVLAVARDLAERNGISLGSAVSELARCGFRAQPDYDQDGVPVFPSAGADPITSDDVRKSLHGWP